MLVAATATQATTAEPPPSLLPVDAYSNYQVLAQMGFHGRVLSDDVFSQETRLSPNPLPGFLIEKMPPEAALDAGAFSTFTEKWPVLSSVPNRELIRKIIAQGTLFVLSDSMCDEKAVTFMKPHYAILRWESVLQRKVQTGMIVSRCLTEQSLHHEYFHTLQYANYDRYLIFTDSIGRMVPAPQERWLDHFHQAIMEIQASIYGIKSVRQLHKIGFNSFTEVLPAERITIEYLADHYRQLLVNMNNLVNRDPAKQAEVLKHLEKFLPIDGDDFYTNPLGWHQFTCVNEKGWRAISDMPKALETVLKPRPCESKPTE
jgi:hypothetical protein